VSGVNCRREKTEWNHTNRDRLMTPTRSTYIVSIAAFLLGFGLGGVSLDVA